MGNNNLVVVIHKLCGFQGRVGGRIVMMEPVVVAPKFRSFPSHISSQAFQNFITDPSGVCKFMDSSLMVFMYEFSNFVNIFCHFTRAW
jgi:hypothetical protein